MLRWLLARLVWLLRLVSCHGLALLECLLEESVQVEASWCSLSWLLSIWISKLLEKTVQIELR